MCLPRVPGPRFASRLEEVYDVLVPMTLRRATFYIAGGTLLAAWFSSAASVTLGRQTRRPPVVTGRDAAAQTEAIAINVQAQSRRLAQRLATAPVPQQPVRNPFAFKPLPVVRSAAPVRASAALAPAPEPEALPIEPPLMLVGLAENRKGDTVVRSAMISSTGHDLIMVEAGTVVLGRYTVTAIGADAVEMKDTSTGLVRRLVLQNH